MMERAFWWMQQGDKTPWNKGRPQKRWTEAICTVFLEGAGNNPWASAKCPTCWGRRRARVKSEITLLSMRLLPRNWYCWPHDLRHLCRQRGGDCGGASGGLPACGARGSTACISIIYAGMEQGWSRQSSVILLVTSTALLSSAESLGFA